MKWFSLYFVIKKKKNCAELLFQHTYCHLMWLFIFNSVNYLLRNFSHSFYFQLFQLFHWVCIDFFILILPSMFCLANILLSTNWRRSFYFYILNERIKKNPNSPMTLNWIGDMFFFFFYTKYQVKKKVEEKSELECWMLNVVFEFKTK